MEKSPTFTKLAQSLAVFQLKVDKIKKDATNPFFKSKYASLSNIQDAISIPLNESGLVYSQMPCGVNELTTMLIHAESGEYFQSTYTMTVAKQNDPQAVGSAITYAKRYALVATLGLNIDDDDDANAATKAPEFVSTTHDKPWLNKFEKDKVTLTKEWENASKKVGDGVITIAKVEETYKLSGALKAELVQIQQTGN